MSYRYPPGWVPPYHGAAPPMPPNVSVNQQQWQMGSWQFNPAYNWRRYSVPQMGWMAAPSWSYPAYRPSQSLPANFNPYKKAIRPPSAEYLAMKVSNNGLDLHNMVPVANRYGDEQKTPDPPLAPAPTTPWLWRPAALADDAPPESAHHAAAAAAAAAAANDRAQNRFPSESQLPASAPGPATMFRRATDPSPSPSPSSASSSRVNASTGTSNADSSSPLKPTFSSKIIRVPAHYAQTSNASTSVDSLVSRVEGLSTSEPPPLGRQSSMPSIYPDSKQPSSISGAQFSDEPLSILSPLIIPMTPHPKRPVTRGATYPNIGNHSGLDTIKEAPAVEVTLPHGSSSRPQETPAHYVPQTAPASQQSFTRPPVSRSESYPRSASSSVFRDTPQDRSISRNLDVQNSQHPSVVQQHTPPDIDSYPALRQTPPRPQTPRRPIEIYAPTPPPQRSHSSSCVPTRHSSSHQLSPTQTSHTTPKHSPPETSHSPKHTPPSTSQDYPITPISLHQNTAPASSYNYEEERPKPVKPIRIYTPVCLPPRQRRRLGFWNRRGDHCTKEGYIVFAPPEQAFPAELSTYPERDYQDDLGFRVAFDPRRPELPESLPRRGQPPEKPYKDFLMYNE
ncbi:hypothetical protein C0989_010689 [Termitomyces sp. Mn162]|nr:hypothetical protein C0989_010689 [Termitomyces sp. Mn162]